MPDVDLLIRELLHKGYHHIGPFHAPSESRPKLAVVREGKPFIVKYSSVSSESIASETSYGRELADIPGIVPIVDAGSVSHNGLFIQYNIKPHLPGPRLDDVSLTRELGDMVLDTQQRMHDRGVLIKCETRRDDFVLDEHGRPTLVDMEYLKTLEEPTSYTLIRFGDHTFEQPSFSRAERRQRWLEKQEDKVHLLSELRHGKNGEIFRGQLLQNRIAYRTVKDGPIVVAWTLAAGTAAYFMLEPLFKRW